MISKIIVSLSLVWILTVMAEERLPEVETTLDGQFIINYPKNQVIHAAPIHHNPSPLPEVTPQNAQVKPVIPNPGPLTAYGHPSDRYRQVNRDVDNNSSSNQGKITEAVEKDSDPDPFASQRRLRPVVIPDAYGAAPITRDQPNNFTTVELLEGTTPSIAPEGPIKEVPFSRDNFDAVFGDSSSFNQNTQAPDVNLSNNTTSTVTPNDTTTNKPSQLTKLTKVGQKEILDYDVDSFARLRDAVIIGDNPQSTLSQSIPRPHLVHPRKPKKLRHQHRQRQLAAPSVDQIGDGTVEDVAGDNIEVIPEAAFPLPNCYRTAGGFLCCNRFLEELIYKSNTHVKRQSLSECNVHAFASTLQTEAEQFFKTTFEIIIGTGDFASKTRFRDNLICKTVADKKVILIYATPEPYSLTQPNTPLSFT